MVYLIARWAAILALLSVCYADAQTYNYGTEGVSIIVYGAVADGVTDAGPAINACISAGQDCVVPPSRLGFFVNTAIQNTGSLRGTVANFYNPSPATTFPNSSFLLCSANVSPCVNVGGNSLPNLNVAGVLSNLIVSRVSGAPTAGVIGVQWNGGYNAHSENIYAFNHDTCYKWFASGVSGISFFGANVNSGACQTHYMVFDGWPEAHFTRGRVGMNGSGDYTLPNDVILITNTSCSSGGCGPNSIVFENYFFIPNAGAKCGINYAGFVNAPSSTIGAEMRFTDDHFEWHTPGGTGFICSDSTVPGIQGFWMSHVSASFGSASLPLFALNSATALIQWFIHDSSFGGCTGITLAPTPVSGPAFSDVHFSRTFGCVGASFTSNGTGNNKLALSENAWGTLAVAGAWGGQLASTNDVYSSLTDTASGNVSWSNAVAQTWTPALSFGGGSTGITYSSQAGTVSRTSDGGFVAAFFIQLTSKGSSTGATSITGLPYRCSNGAQSVATGGASGFYNNMAGLSGSVTFTQNSGNSSLLVQQPAAAAAVQITDTNFTNVSQLAGTVKCAHTL